MKRRLFCELSPLTYRISCIKGCLLRDLRDLFTRGISKARTESRLPKVVYKSNSLIRRRLGNVDRQLQENKAVNLSIAAPRVNGVLIRPGEVFSLWRLVGACTVQKGYKDGLLVSSGELGSGIGGGMCQITNLIHWMVLHTPLTITEHHHHDGVDLFPDYGRTIPFGTGTSIFYNYRDYRFQNTTDVTYQLIIYVTDDYLCGEIRAERLPEEIWHITVEDEHFSQEPNGIYRNGRIIRTCINRASGNTVDQQCIKVNHAKVMYEMDTEKIRK